MKVFFISDIHGNYYALKSILEYANKLKSDLIFCNGDLCNYFLDINKVISLLNSYNVKVILGNHDAFLLGLLPISEKASYFSSYKYSKKNIDIDSYKWMEGLKSTDDFDLGNKKVKLFHGGPVDLLNQYVFPDQIDTKHEGYYNAEIIIFGHSHLQFGVNKNDQFFINPGSVGLPRNGDVRAHGVSYDSESQEFQEHKVRYDVEKTIYSHLNKISFNPIYLHNILFGRSSSKELKANRDLFLSDVLYRKLKCKSKMIVNTVYGAIIYMMELDEIIYIANYVDESIQITTSTLFFNWQKKQIKDFWNYIGINKLNFTIDTSGIFIKKEFISRDEFEREITFEFEEIIKLINITSRKKWKNITF